MKNSLKVVKSVLVMMFLFFTFGAYAQCDVTKYTDKCVEKLKPAGFRYLKSYKIDTQNGKKAVVDYAYVLSAGITYIITLSSTDTKGLFVRLLDSQKKEIVSSYNGSQFFPAVQIKAQKTGIYYFSYAFKDSKTHCGASVLGLKR